TMEPSKYAEYSDKIFHHPCRVFKDYFALKEHPKPKVLEELFYSALFAHFITKTTGDETFVQAPPQDPPDSKMLVPFVKGDKAGYRDIEIFKATGLKSEQDILVATKNKMKNKYYGDHYVLIGVLHPDERTMFLDAKKLEPLFKNEKFTLGHIFFIFPTIEVVEEKLIFKYVLIQTQPIFTFLTVDLEDLKKVCNSKTGGFFFELKGKGRKKW
ncbi:MAG: hypothetical protein Q7S76_00595, partial [bacterium]|nr:hypothetical protein [bacterium]